MFVLHTVVLFYLYEIKSFCFSHHIIFITIIIEIENGKPPVVYSILYVLSDFVY